MNEILNHIHMCKQISHDISTVNKQLCDAAMRRRKCPMVPDGEREGGDHGSGQGRENRGF